MFLPGESQGQGSLVGCRLWGRTESDTTEATWQQQQQAYKLFEVMNHDYLFHFCILNLGQTNYLQCDWSFLVNAEGQVQVCQ